MGEIERYAKERLENILHEISRVIPIQELSEISFFEAALIYKYTEDGYDVNRLLKEGVIDLYATLLSKIIEKLPDYKGTVYRGAYLNKQEKDAFVNAFNSNENIRFSTFMSCSKKVESARMWTDMNNENGCLITIQSKTGKEIEVFSKYGKYTAQNEFEVLFDRNTKFSILDIGNRGRGTELILEQL